MSEARLRLDINYCMDTAVGPEKGLSIKDLEAFSGRLEAIHKELDEERRLGQHSYRDLYADQITREEVKEYAAWARNRFLDFLVIGIGGSSLGPAALINALSHPYHNLLTAEQRAGTPRIFLLENPDPTSLRATLDVLDLPNTLVNVITKSGSTVETWANFAAVYEPLRAAVPAEDLRDHVVVTTDFEQGDLYRLATEMNFRAFGIPRGIAGRYAVLSPVGLLPLAIAGHSVDELLEGAREMDEVARSVASPFRNPAYAYALVHYLMDELKDVRQNVFFPYTDRLGGTADWFRHLWAESLGKKHSVMGDTLNAGPTPIKALGASDQHSQIQLYVEGPFDKLITFVEVADLANQEPIPSPFPELESVSYLGGHNLGHVLNIEKKATEYALTRAGRPNLTVTVPTLDTRTQGHLLTMLMIATTVAGKLYEVNCYDQPGVEEGKTAIYALLGKKAYAERRHEYLGRFPKQERFLV
jgi:glucose-6-phosphate isomerase